MSLSPGQGSSLPFLKAITSYLDIKCKWKSMIFPLKFGIWTFKGPNFLRGVITPALKALLARDCAEASRGHRWFLSVRSKVKPHYISYHRNPSQNHNSYRTLGCLSKRGRKNQDPYEECLCTFCKTPSIMCDTVMSIQILGTRSSWSLVPGKKSSLWW